jgi:predicted O-methyltransferase YrrM
MRRQIVRHVAQLVHAWPPVARQVYRARYGPLGPYLAEAARVPGWLGRREAFALGEACAALPAGAVVVEIGSFLGRSTIVLAGARKRGGSGTIHCIDPFDASGDAFSVPVYRSIVEADSRSLRQRFHANLARAGVAEWVEVHEGTAASVAAGWSAPIDMLFLDGDQSAAGARSAYDSWAPFLKPGAIVALHNSAERVYAPSHDGYFRLTKDVIRPPEYDEIRCVETTTFARKRPRLSAPPPEGAPGARAAGRGVLRE